MTSRFITAVRRNVVAWLALFVALTGTSMAASHYIITSTHQIKPSVLSKLKGARGARGATGPQGVAGTPGPAGKNGATGPPGIKGETGSEGKETKSGTGTEGKQGVEGKQGPEGKPGTPGEAGTALAFAHIKASGEIEASPNSKGFETATIIRPEAGVYCISGLTVALHNVVVTADNKASEFGTFATASLGRSFFVNKENSCSATTTQVTVETWELAPVAGKLESKTEELPFFIVIN